MAGPGKSRAAFLRDVDIGGPFCIHWLARRSSDIQTSSAASQTDHLARLFWFIPDRSYANPALMTDSVSLSFGPLEDRARADAPDADRISLRDFPVDVEIGAFEVERGTKQRLQFSVVVAVAPPDAEVGDDVDRILSYDTIADAIRAELAAERLALLETLAERISLRLLAEPQARQVWIRIEKLDRGPGALGIEVVRQSSKQAASGATPPVVVDLGALTGAPEAAVKWLDYLHHQEKPVLVCADADIAAPSNEAQRRIALLTRDAATWALSMLHAKAHVAATRTEVDWALAQGRLTLWAPGKILLDTPGAPDAAAEGAVLAGWMADRLGAQKLVVVGRDLPAGVRTPAISVETETLSLG